MIIPRQKNVGEKEKGNWESANPAAALTDHLTFRLLSMERAFRLGCFYHLSRP